MKLLATIKSIKLHRKYARPDGTFANVFGITIEAGDDTILAETFLSYEGQKKRGITSGAIGTAILSLDIKEWLDKSGESRQMQVIRITDFQLANRNISTESAQTAAGGATEQPKEEKPADGTQVPAEPQEPKPEEGKTSDLPF